MIMKKTSSTILILLFMVSMTSATTISSSGVSLFTYDVKIESTSGNNDLWVYRNLASGSTSGPVTFIEQDNTGDDQSPLVVQNDGTGMGFWLDQNGDARGLSIDSEATTLGSYGLQVDTVTADPAIFSSDASTYAVIGHTDRSSATFFFNRDTDSTGTQSPVMYVRQDNAGDDQNAFVVKQDGTGNAISLQNIGTGAGLYIDQNGNGMSIDIDSESTSEPALRINQLATTGYAALADLDSLSGLFYFYKNQNAAASVAPTMYILSDDATDDQDVLAIKNDGTGYGINVQSNIKSDSLLLQNSANQYTILARSNTTTSGTNFFYRNLNNVNAPVVFIEQDDATDDEDALAIQNDGTARGLFIDQNGDAQALRIDSEATNKVAIGFDAGANGGCAAGQYGIYTNSTSHLLYCRNGVSTYIGD